MGDSRLVAFDVGTLVAALSVNAALGQSRLGSFAEFRIAAPAAPFRHFLWLYVSKSAEWNS